MRARIAGDELCQQIVALQKDDIDKPAEAKRLGVPILAVYNARRRLSGHIEAMRAELREEARDD